MTERWGKMNSDGARMPVGVVPLRLRLFWYLAIVHFLIELGWSISHFDYTSGRYGGLVFVGGEVIGLATLGAAWLVAYRRIGWLRWLVAASYILGLFDTSWAHSSSRLFLLYLPQSFVDVAAIYFAFSGNAADWLSTSNRERRGFFVNASSAVCGTVLMLAVASGALGRLVSLFHSPSSPTAEAASPFLTSPIVPVDDPAAAFLGRLFTDACLANIGNPDQVRSWAVKNEMLVVSDPRFIKAYAGEGAKGAVWRAPSTAGEFYLSLRGEGEACVAWARRATVSDAEAAFKAALENAKKQDTKLTVTGDDVTSTPSGNAHVVKLQSHTPSTRSAAVYSIITVERDSGPFQVMLEALGGTAQ